MLRIISILSHLSRFVLWPRTLGNIPRALEKNVRRAVTGGAVMGGASMGGASRRRPLGPAGRQ